MKKSLSHELPGGVVVLRIDRIERRAPEPDACTVYFITFAGGVAMGQLPFGRFEGLYALRDALGKLEVAELAIEAALYALVHESHHEIPGVMLTPTIARQLGL